MILVISDPDATSNKDWVDIELKDIYRIINTLRILAQDSRNILLSSLGKPFFNNGDIISSLDMTTGSIAKFILLEYLPCPKLRLDIYDDKKELKYTEEFCADTIIEDLKTIESSSLFSK